MQHLIREATIHDADTIGRFAHALLAELTPGRDQPPDKAIHDARALLAEGRITALLGQDRGRAAGMITLQEGAAIFAGGHYGVINELYVLPPYRSLGLARDLVLAAVKLARTRGWTRLEVGAPGTPAWARTLAFYRREGFVELGPRLRKAI